MATITMKGRNPTVTLPGVLVSSLLLSSLLTIIDHQAALALPPDHQ